MQERAIIIVDGGYVRQCLKSRFVCKDEGIQAKAIYSWLCGKLIKRVSAICSMPLYLFRVQYYDCLSYQDPIWNPYTGTKVYLRDEQRDKFLSTLHKMSKVYMRLGRLAITGWKPIIDPKKIKLQEDETNPVSISAAMFQPLFQQKEVDIKIAMDFCQILNHRLAHVLIILSDDSDFLPLFEEARKLGLLIVLINLRPANQSSSKILRKSVDYFESVDDSEIDLPARKNHPSIQYTFAEQDEK